MFRRTDRTEGEGEWETGSAAVNKSTCEGGGRERVKEEEREEVRKLPENWS